MQAKPPVIFVTALSCEARPLLDKFSFSQIESAPFPLYYAQEQQYLLIVSGIGAKRMATAIGYLNGKLLNGNLDNQGFATASYLTDYAIWINFGVCGHKDHPLGSGFLIHKINDTSNGEVFYPWRLPYLQSAEINCYDRPQSSYPDQALVDMESAGFFSSASLFSNNELTHLYKVVGDNQDNPATEITKDKLVSLLGEQVPKLIDFIASLRDKLATEFTANLNMRLQINQWRDELSNLCHWTQTQQQQLTQLLQSHYALDTDMTKIIAEIRFGGQNREDQEHQGSFKSNSKNILSALDKELQQD